MAYVWRHKKTGGLYIILGQCRIEATNTSAVRYRSIDDADKVEWVRPITEFHDGRFQRVQVDQTPLI